MHSFHYDEVDPDETYDAEAELGDEAIVDGNDPSALTGEMPNAERITTPYMTKYERARILGTRALQIRWVLVVGARQFHGRGRGC